ncbi:MAG: hypothetical protein LBU32_07710 [Clostridiales bacterium]|jgi:GNAT superfamily N-acetyltransferase|nr:hypothetical protein [Clostridiales bacterium]
MSRLIPANGSEGYILRSAAFLKARVLYNMMYSLHKAPHQGFFACDGSLLALTAPEKPMWIWCDPGLDEKEKACLLQELALRCAASKDPLDETVLDPHSADFFNSPYLRCWNRMHPEKLKRRTRFFYSYFNLRPAKVELKVGRLYIPSISDAKEISSLVAGFNKDALGCSFSASQAFLAAEALISSKRMLCWKDESIACMCIITACCENISRLNYIYTPAHLRGKGYAQALASSASAIVLRQGFLPVLYADAGNAPANLAYRKAGFSPAGVLRKTKYIPDK